LPLSPPPDTPRRFDDAEIRRVGRWRGAHGLTTVTRKLPLLTLPAASVAVQVTVVMPLLNELPLAGTQACVTAGQLSVAEAEKITLLAQPPPGVVTTMGDGQEIIGASVSLTVTVNVQALVLPLASVAMQVTVVTPWGKIDPGAGTQLVVTGQLSAAVGAA